MILRRLQPSEAGEFDAWIASNHYRECAPAGAVLRLEFLEGSERVGGMMWGRPEARLLDEDATHILENTRTFFNPQAGGFRSENLASARKFIRKWFPQIRLVLAYADPEEGHVGTVYLADGWASFGKTTPKEKGWMNREGRKDECGHSKRRFVRTP